MAESRSRTVVFLGPAYPYRGGIASFTERLAYQYQQEGWDVKILTYTLQYPQILFPGKNQYSEDVPNYNLDRERVIHSLNPLSWRKTRKYIIELSPDLVISPHWNPFMSLSLSLILGKLTVPKVVIVHNIFPHESGFFDTNLVRKIMKVDAHFLTISDSVHDELSIRFPFVESSQYPHPYYDHYGPIVEKASAAKVLDLNDKRDYLLFFGLVRPYKGLSQLITAFSDIVYEWPSLDLIIAGEFYESVEIYKRIINRDNLTDRIILRDHFVPDNLVSAYFSVSDLVILPYMSATQSGVGQIATHFDKPILVTNVGSLAQMTHHGTTGLVVESNSKSISQGINKFYRENMKQGLTQNILNHKSEISWAGLYSHICNATNK